MGGGTPPLLYEGGKGCSPLNVWDLMRFIDHSNGPMAGWAFALRSSRKCAH